MPDLYVLDQRKHEPRGSLPVPAQEGVMMPARLLTDDEAAGMLGISLGGLKELIAGEVLHPAGDIGRRFDAAEVEGLLNGSSSQGYEPGRPTGAPRRVLDVGTVAALYAVDAKTVARWDKLGKLPPSFRTPGGRRRFYEDEIMAQLDASRSRPPPP